jgi:hypothetical protein
LLIGGDTLLVADLAFIHVVHHELPKPKKQKHDSRNSCEWEDVAPKVFHFRPRSQAARDRRLARSSIASVLICLLVTMAQ